DTFGRRLISELASLSSFSGAAPMRRKMGTTMPSLSSSSAARTWTGSTSGLPCCEAISLAACTASCDFKVNLSQRIGIFGLRVNGFCGLHGRSGRQWTSVHHVHSFVHNVHSVQ